MQDQIQPRPRQKLDWLSLASNAAIWMLQGAMFTIGAAVAGRGVVAASRREALPEPKESGVITMRKSVQT